MTTTAPPIVRIGNYAPMPFRGWVRTTIDQRPSLDSGEQNVHRLSGSWNARFVVGPAIGVDCWLVDVWVDLDAGEEVALDLSHAHPWQFNDGPAHADPLAFFGGLPSINGILLQPDQAIGEGAGVALHFRARVPDSLLHYDLWALWRPDEKAIVHAELVIAASNDTKPDVVTFVPDLRLTWGDAIVKVHGAGWNAPVLPAGTIAYGQARGVPLTLFWLRHLDAASWAAAPAAAERSVCAVGAKNLWSDGEPHLHIDFDARQWTLDRWTQSLQRLHTWEPALLGPNPRSGDTGGQEDQIFVRGEALLPGGLGAEQIAYFAALKILARPCHHLRWNGQLQDPRLALPLLRYWDGYVHPSAVVSPNRLGKARGPDLWESRGWSGPDVEHWLLNTTAAAARLTGSRALQWELRNQAMVYFGQQTVNPGWSTSQAYAARAVGWEAIAVVHLFRTLEDRDLAAAVLAHFQQRWAVVIGPWIGTNDIIDVRVNDPRLGPGAWWMPWQVAVCAYGLDLAGAEFQLPELRAVALRLAKAIVRDAWVKFVADGQPSRWRSAPLKPVDMAVPFNSDEAFNLFGMPLAPAVVLRHEPGNTIAREIWDQCVADNHGHSWLVPGVA